MDLNFAFSRFFFGAAVEKLCVRSFFFHFRWKKARGSGKNAAPQSGEHVMCTRVGISHSGDTQHQPWMDLDGRHNMTHGSNMTHGRHTDTSVACQVSETMATMSCDARRCKETTGARKQHESERATTVAVDWEELPARPRVISRLLCSSVLERNAREIKNEIVYSLE